MKVAQFRENGTLRLGLVGDGGLQPLDFGGGLIGFIVSDRATVPTAPLLTTSSHFRPSRSIRSKAAFGPHEPAG